MCWIGDNKNEHIAIDDIKCKKILLKETIDNSFCYYSPIFNQIYKIGETYTSNPIIPKLYGNGPRVVIHEGIHCYDIKKTKAVITKDVFGKRNLVIYSIRWLTRKYKYRPLIGWGEYAVAVECIIPKGTIYYENQNGEIVTQNLKIIRELKENEYVLDK